MSDRDKVLREIGNAILQAGVGVGPEIEAGLFEAYRAGMLRAAEIADGPANRLAEWMASLPYDSPDRKDKSLRAGELFETARKIREEAERAE